MEISLKGILETLIDDLTAEEGLTTAFVLIRSFKPLVRSEQDAVFGYIFAVALSFFAEYYYTKYKRKANTSEIETFQKMLEERSYIIMSKIQKFSNR